MMKILVIFKNSILYVVPSSLFLVVRYWSLPFYPLTKTSKKATIRAIRALFRSIKQKPASSIKKKPAIYFFNFLEIVPNR